MTKNELWSLIEREYEKVGESEYLDRLIDEWTARFGGEALDLE